MNEENEVNPVMTEGYPQMTWTPKCDRHKFFIEDVSVGVVDTDVENKNNQRTNIVLS